MSRRVKWQGPDGLVSHAAEIVDRYDTGVTLRQLFYLLVAGGILPNTRTYYQSLSAYTAEARRDGTFPDLLDRTSQIAEHGSFDGPDQALEWLADIYREDRTEGQEWQVWLGVEKAGISAQLDAWFTDPLGIPHVALGGYPSQTLCDQVWRRIEADGRPAVLIYAGDHDPTGEDIDRDFSERVGMFDKVIRVALNAEQLDLYDIPQNVLDPAVVRKLEDDPRAGAFMARHGYLDQYEVDALPPEILRSLYQEAIGQFWDGDAFDQVITLEEEHRAQLAG